MQRSPSGESREVADAQETAATVTASHEGPRQRLLVVHNARAGGGDGDGLEVALEALRQNATVTTLAFETVAEARRDLHRRLDAGEADVVVAAGGDGTVSFVAGELLDRREPLGILPLGTANDCARTLGIPGAPLDAAQVILAGRTHRIDVGLVNGRPFVNAVGIGISVAVSRDAPAAGKDRLGVFAYLLTALRAIRTTTGFRVQLAGDEHRWRGRALQVTVANGRHYGGGMTARSDARIDDGRLDVLVVKPAGALRLLQAALHLRLGRYAPSGPVHVLSARTVSVRTHPGVAFAADGEECGRTPLEASVRRQALPVIVPADFETAAAASQA